MAVITPHTPPEAIYPPPFMRKNKKRRCGACTASQRYMIFNRLGDTQSHLSEG
nr:MAG TPA: putative zinc-ribbon domain protein [Caudoviricetes sp.]